MTYDPDKHHRRSIRLRGYDYAQPGAYFVTICTQGKKCLLGEVFEGKMRWNDAGRMVKTVWEELPNHYHGVDIDAFVVMPNHVHGIVILASTQMALPDVVHRFKSLTTARYRQGVVKNQWPPFSGRLWQRNYYEHIIRNEEDLNRLQQYIQDNPPKWEQDRENPITQ